MFVRNPKNASMLITKEDCQLLARYQESKPWNDAEESDRNAIKDLWNRLKNVAIEGSRRYSGSTKVKEFSSHPTPNGRTPKELWSCVYPKTVPNKSYGLQVALIVWGQGAEICFCLSSGSGQINNVETRQKSEIALAQLKMGLQRLPLELRQEIGATVAQGWALRSDTFRNRLAQPTDCGSSKMESPSGNLPGGIYPMRQKADSVLLRFTSQPWYDVMK